MLQNNKSSLHSIIEESETDTYQPFVALTRLSTNEINNFCNNTQKSCYKICILCNNDRFFAPLEYQLHMKLAHKKAESNVEESYSTEASASMNQEDTKNSQKLVRCKRCSVYMEEYLRKQHSCGNVNYECKYCELLFASSTLRDLHHQRHNYLSKKYENLVNETLNTSYCQSTIDENSAENSTDCNQQTRQLCEECGIDCDNLNELKLHAIEHNVAKVTHQNGDISDLDFQTNPENQDNIDPLCASSGTHCESLNECLVCDETFEDFDALREHMSSHFPE